ncbi:MAG: transcriptional regulator NrdR [Candidatus Marinimicrobia bacterium]|nr:transcriptional regulator NrdR [Candidatus Neomarinimicrobiota bacterium]
MKCPFCSSSDIKVIDSRSAQKGTAIRRRRECLECHHRFTTYEHVIETPVSVIKNDGSREEFDRTKLERSLKIACNKRKISSDIIEHIIKNIVSQVEDLGKTEVESSFIGELVMQYLKKYDDVAYIRYASVYKKFKDIDEFRDQIEHIARDEMEQKKKL